MKLDISPEEFARLFSTVKAKSLYARKPKRFYCGKRKGDYLRYNIRQLCVVALTLLANQLYASYPELAALAGILAGTLSG